MPVALLYSSVPMAHLEIPSGILVAWHHLPWDQGLVLSQEKQNHAGTPEQEH